MEGHRKVIRALYPETGERGVDNASAVHMISRLGIEAYVRQFTGNKRELRRALRSLRSLSEELDIELLGDDAK